MAGDWGAPAAVDPIPARLVAAAAVAAEAAEATVAADRTCRALERPAFLLLLQQMLYLPGGSATQQQQQQHDACYASTSANRISIPNSIRGHDVAARR